MTNFPEKMHVVFNRLILPILLVFLSTGIEAQTAIPLPSPYLWYKADNIFNTGGEVSDFSGNGRTAFTSAGLSVSDSGMINFNKAFVFKSNGADLRTTALPDNKNRVTVFCVYRSDNAVSRQFVWTMFFDSTHVAALTTRELKTFMMDKGYSDTTSTKAILNTTSIGWPEVVADTANRYISLGNRDSANFSGDMAEIMLYDRALDSIEQVKVQSYLALKYGITLYKSDYLSAGGTILWDESENQLYHLEIGGIGKDSLSGLNQKQSAADGGENMLCIAAGQKAGSNMMNPHEITENNFLIWGSNGNALSAAGSQSREGDQIGNLPARRWLMQVSGADADEIPTQVILNAPQGFISGNTCYLVIDRSGTGNFSAANTELIYPDSIDGSQKVYYSNVKWDSDSGGKDVFTFLSGSRLTLVATASPDSSSNSGTINMEVLDGNGPFVYSLVQEATGAGWEWNSAAREQHRYNLPFGAYRVCVSGQGGGKDSLIVVISGSRNMMQQDPATVAENTGVSAGEGIIEHAEVYPNPTEKHYSIKIKLSEISDITMRISDQQGKYLEWQVKKGSNEYTFEGIIEAAGVYCVEFSTGNEKKSVKLVISD